MPFPLYESLWKDDIRLAQDVYGKVSRYMTANLTSWVQIKFLGKRHSHEEKRKYETCRDHRLPIEIDMDCCVVPYKGTVLTGT